jgi:hypothetical protein
MEYNLTDAQVKLLILWQAQKRQPVEGPAATGRAPAVLAGADFASKDKSAMACYLLF